MIVFRWVHLPLFISMTANPLHSVVDLSIFDSQPTAQGSGFADFFLVFTYLSPIIGAERAHRRVLYRVCLDSTLLFPGRWDAALRP